MDRRHFLQLFGAGAAGIALEQAIPLGRVWSFPSQILLPGHIMLPAGAAVRFIRAWDMREAEMINRVDVMSRGFHPSANGIEHCYVVQNPNDRAISVRVPGDPEPGAILVLRQELERWTRLGTPPFHFRVDVWTPS